MITQLELHTRQTYVFLNWSNLGFHWKFTRWQAKCAEIIVLWYLNDLKRSLLCDDVMIRRTQEVLRFFSALSADAWEIDCAQQGQHWRNLISQITETEAVALKLWVRYDITAANLLTLSGFDHRLAFMARAFDATFPKLTWLWCKESWNQSYHELNFKGLNW